MTLSICYGPIVDGAIDEDLCATRDAILYEETVEGEVVQYYALPDDRTADEFTVTELNQADAEALAERVCSRAADIHDSEWGWEIK